MSDRTDDLLERELGKLGAIGGIAGGAVGSLAGAAGARIAARFLPTEQYEQELHLQRPADAVLRQAFTLLSSQGQIIDEDESDRSEQPKISAVVGSGALNMNPTILSIAVVDWNTESCTILVFAAAKEGLIKQKTAEKAVHRFVNLLRPGS
ncbi:MAG: hypothetical protein IH944_01445 [Armatimonadetes bacterium]|nr:hypothetical protein [Armatimonadota bacterium]